MNRLLKACALALALAAAHPAHAALLLYRFGGVVTADGGTGYQTFSGELLFDDSLPDGLPDDPRFGVYESQGGSTRLSMAFDGGLAAVYHHVTVTIGNGTGPNGADQFAFTGQPDVGFGVVGALLDQADGSLFDDDRLSGLPPLHADRFDGLRRFFQFEPGAGDGARQLTGRLDTLHCVEGCPLDPAGQVPLPSTLSLLPLAALAGLRVARPTRSARR